MHKLIIVSIFVLLFGSIILFVLALLRKHQANVLRRRYGDIILPPSSTSGCYFLNGVNGTQLFVTASSGNQQPWIKLNSNPPNRTQWYYNDAEGSIYAMRDSGGVSGFLVANAPPRAIPGMQMPVTVWDPTQFYNKQASINPLAIGWNIQGLDPNNSTSSNVTISWQNSGVAAGKWYLQSNPNPVGYSMLSQTLDSNFQATLSVDPGCMNNCQNQNLSSCLASNPEKQQECLNECSDEPSLGCPLGCAIDRSIWDALCHNEINTNPTDCNSTCDCSPPPPLAPICGPQAINGVCPPGKQCVNGTCNLTSMDLSSLNGAWLCKSCQVANGVGMITMSNGTGTELAGEFMINFTYTYQGGNQYNMNGPAELGNQTATLSADGKTLTVGNVDVWTKP